MIMQSAPELQTSHWFNTDVPVTLASLRGRVVVIEAFQMLCPGCVSHGLPQAQRVANIFERKDVAVLGLHTVFEHHAAQGTVEALAAFLHEYRISFPVALDAPSEDHALPRTMSAYRMQGTPSLLLIDRQGRLRKQAFGAEQDMQIGADIMSLVCETDKALSDSPESTPSAGSCDEKGCAI
ncbi:MAG: redoxin domain-containing protein [Pseudomonadota bacterium]